MWEDNDLGFWQGTPRSRSEICPPSSTQKHIFPTWNSFDTEYLSVKGSLGLSKKEQSSVLWAL